MLTTIRKYRIRKIKVWAQSKKRPHRSASRDEAMLGWARGSKEAAEYTRLADRVRLALQRRRSLKTATKAEPLFPHSEVRCGRRAEKPHHFKGEFLSIWSD
jgi:hypothetical protein